MEVVREERDMIARLVRQNSEYEKNHRTELMRLHKTQAELLTRLREFDSFIAAQDGSDASLYK
jgi:hypothetical protein